MKNLVYLSYDGLLEPLGSSQVLEYVKILSKDNNFFLITFEKPSDLNNKKLFNEIKATCDDRNIRWIFHTYHPFSRPFRASFSILNFITKLIYLLASKNIDGIHLRGYFLGCFVLPLKFIFKFKIFFDTRGFWPDEKADRAGWNRDGFTFRAFKKLEDYLFFYSDHIFFLTENAINLVSDRYPLIHEKSSVIRTCANKKFFYPIVDCKKFSFLNLGYLGTIDTAYDFKKIASFLSSALKVDKKIHITIMTRSNNHLIKEIFNSFEISDDFYTINFTRSRQDLNKVINSFDACIFYLNENYSIKASMPTKIAEVLACGVPIICNAFNEDIKNVLNSNCSVLSDFDPSDSDRILKELIELKISKDTPSFCLNAYKQYFSLEVGCNAYNSIYTKNLG